MKYFVNAFRIIVGSLFIFSGFVKAVDPLGTSFKMKDYFGAFSADNFIPGFWDFLGQYSTTLSILFVSLEFFLGVMLIIGWKPKITVTFIYFLTLYFTALTGYTYLSGFCLTKSFAFFSMAILILLAIVPFISRQGFQRKYAVGLVGLTIAMLIAGKFGGLFFKCDFTESNMKVTDCGCFGDFMKLHPKESFWKDIVLTIMILVMVLGVKEIKSPLTSGFLRISKIITAVVILFFSVYNVMFSEPLIDFRGWKVGNKIEDQMKEIPDVLQLIYIYEDKTTGEQAKYFSGATGTEADQRVIDSLGLDGVTPLLWKDKAWMDAHEYKDREDKVIKKGVPAKIHDFYIKADTMISVPVDTYYVKYDGTDSAFTVDTTFLVERDTTMDITMNVINSPNYQFFVIVWDLEKAKQSAFKKINELQIACEKAGIKFYGFASGSTEDIEKFRHDVQCAFPFTFIDEKALKTATRSNPGLILLKDGFVKGKWHYRQIPSFEKVNNKFLNQ